MAGHIRKRGRDSWTVVLDLGRDTATGQRRRLWRSVKGTKRDAEALLVQLLHQLDTGIPSEKRRSFCASPPTLPTSWSRKDGCPTSAWAASFEFHAMGWRPG